jgi:Ala-tRNA(Pro) deacylase
MDNAIMHALKTILETLSIKVEMFEHQAVYNCEQANALMLDIPGTKTKNLFLKDKKGKRHFLVVIEDHKVLNLKTLARLFEVNSLSFASGARLNEYLVSEEGRVSILDILKDEESKVELFIDEQIWQNNAIQCHPTRMKRPG